MKKLISIILILVLALSLVCICACKDNEQTEENSNLQISESSLNLAQYEQHALTVKDADGNKVTAVWSSSNTSVATVQKGIVSALASGTAEITAKVGNDTVKCVVTVAQASDYPLLQLSQYNAKVLVDGEVTVYPYVSFKGVDVDELPAFTAVSLDEDICSVDVDGDQIIITANALGSALVKIGTNYLGANLERAIQVNVVEGYSATLNVNKQELYTATFGDKYSDTATLQIQVNSISGEVESPVINWSTDNASVATVSNGVVTAVGIGEATIKGEYVSANGISYYDTCRVTVHKTSIDVPTISYIEVGTGEQNVDFITAFGISQGEYNIYDSDGQPVENTNGEAKFAFKATDFGEYHYVIESKSGNAEYNVTLGVVTAFISSYQDYVNARTNFTSGGTWNGYFVQTANFEFPSEANAGIAYDWKTATTAIEFAGIYNGNGYAITGGTFHYTSIFGKIGEGATVKNLAMVGGNFGIMGGLATQIAGNVDNCLIEGSFAAAYDNQSALAYNVLPTAHVTNTVVIFPNANSGAVAAMIGGVLDNVYVFSSKVTGYGHTNYSQSTNVQTYSYNASIGNIAFVGLNDFFDLTGEKVSFKSLAE